jgi:hypothetical protein
MRSGSTAARTNREGELKAVQHALIDAVRAKATSQQAPVMVLAVMILDNNIFSILCLN